MRKEGKKADGCSRVLEKGRGEISYCAQPAGERPVVGYRKGRWQGALLWLKRMKRERERERVNSSSGCVSSSTTTRRRREKKLRDSLAEALSCGASRARESLFTHFGSVALLPSLSWDCFAGTGGRAPIDPPSGPLPPLLLVQTRVGASTHALVLCGQLSTHTRKSVSLSKPLLPPSLGVVSSF